jgi:hypothetical protein
MPHALPHLIWALLKVLAPLGSRPSLRRVKLHTGQPSVSEVRGGERGSLVSYGTGRAQRSILNDPLQQALDMNASAWR